MKTNDIKYLKTVDELRNVMARYARRADIKDWSGLANLFVSEGKFTSLRGGIPHAKIVGREEIADKLKKCVGNKKTVHHLFSFEIDIHSETEASGVFAMEDLFMKADNRPLSAACGDTSKTFKTMHSYGHYCADFTKVGQEWLISDLILARAIVNFTY